MTKLEQASLDFIGKIQELYFEKQDVNGLLEVLDDGIRWIGTGNIHGCGKDNARRSLLKEKERFPNRFHVLQSSYETHPYAEELCGLHGQIWIGERAAEAQMPNLLLWVSAVVRLTEKGPRLVQIHLSEPVPNPKDGLFSCLTVQESTAPLRRMLNEKSKKLTEKAASLDMLLHHLPGGIVQCDQTWWMNLLQYNQGFLDLFGYSREEITNLFQNQYSRLILPEDWETAWQMISNQLEQGDVIEVEYRAICKDGTVIWVLDRGRLVRGIKGEKSFYSILTDVTHTHRAEEELRLSLERHRIIMDQTADIIFEWDIQQDRVICSANWQKKFGYAPVTTGNEFRALKHIHPDEAYLFQGLIQKIIAGICYCATEIRVANAEGRYSWYRIRVSLQLDGSGQPLKAVGVIIDIDGEKREAQKLLDRAERDTLTGLYNKGAVQSLIEEYLNIRLGECALMIIDVDNFKLVNDRLGHLSGDVLLSDIARTLQKQFRTMDLLGRIGGDEFIVLMRDIPNKEIVSRKVEALLKAFHSLVDWEHPISCSIGIAIAPKDGADYPTLFRNADFALYHAKTQGKNTGAFYTPERADFPGAACQGRIPNTKIDSDRGGDTVNVRLVEYIFHTLYASRDLGQAIPQILEIVGKQFDVSRAYIFENSPDGQLAENTFEWCGEGIPSKLETFRYIPLEDLNYYQNFDLKGIFYFRDAAQLPHEVQKIAARYDAKSTLQCVIRDNGQNKGFIGFDECRNNRLWTGEQMETLAFVAEVVGVFLLKSRAQYRMAQTLHSLELLLDSQESMIYVIDKSTFRLLYANRKTKIFKPGSVTGVLCHRAFFRREEPCEECPILSLFSAADEKKCGVYISGFGEAYRFTVTKITWPGTGEAFLLVSQAE